MTKLVCRSFVERQKRSVSTLLNTGWIEDGKIPALKCYDNIVIHVKDRHCLSQKRSVAKTTTSSRLESCARNLFNGSDAGIKFFWLANFLD